MSTGVGLKRAMLLNLAQAVLGYIGFVLAVFIDNRIEQFDTWLYALAAGNYLYICIGCLVSREIQYRAKKLWKQANMALSWYNLFFT
jgi:hypothetical protein